MGEYRRVLFDMYIRKEYRSYITDVYKNMDWRLFPDPRICGWTIGRLNDNERMLLFSPDGFDGESTWDENTGRLRLNRHYDTGIYRDCYVLLMMYYTYLPDYCEDGKMCFYSEYEYSGEESCFIFDLKRRRRAKVDHIPKELCDDISDYEKLADEWIEYADEFDFGHHWTPKHSDRDYTDKYILNNGNELNRATERELEELSDNSKARLADISEFIDEDGTFDIPEYLREIGPYTFYNCRKIKRVIFRHKYLKIHEYAFLACTELEEVILPDKNTESESFIEIGKGAFSGCLRLKRAHLPKWLQRIKEYLFFGCVSLEEVILPAGAEECRQYAVEKGIDTNNVYQKWLKGLELILPHSFSLCRRVKSISLPESVTLIGDEAFSYCSMLEDISLPHALAEIGGRAFYGCGSIRQIKIPQGTRRIGEWAFNNCSGLSAVIIPPAAVVIGERPFTESTIISMLSGHVFHNAVLQKDGQICYEYQYSPIKGLKISCAENSAAEFYARYHSIPFEICDGAGE